MTTLEAIKESRKHWEKMMDSIKSDEYLNHHSDDYEFIVDGKTYRYNSNGCALCYINTNEEGRINCEKCPIRIYTGNPSCLGTPWLVFRNSLINSNKTNAIKAANNMINLLKKLEEIHKIPGKII